jgi:hypothetical protein
MASAHFWRMRPDEFDGAPNDLKARMIAFRIASATLESWQYEVAEKAAGQDSGGMRR